MLKTLENPEKKIDWRINIVGKTVCIKNLFSRFMDVFKGSVTNNPAHSVTFTSVWFWLYHWKALTKRIIHIIKELCKELKGRRENKSRQLALKWEMCECV